MIDPTKLIAYYVARKTVSVDREIVDIDVPEEEQDSEDLDIEVDLPITDDTIIED